MGGGVWVGGMLGALVAGAVAGAELLRLLLLRLLLLLLELEEDGLALALRVRRLWLLCRGWDVAAVRNENIDGPVEVHKRPSGLVPPVFGELVGEVLFG